MKFARSGALLKGAPIFTSKKNERQLFIKSIVILGDSVAYGYGTRGGIAKHLKAAFPGTTVSNLGINGLTSDGLIERFQAGRWDRTLQSADLVLLNIGGNDLLRGFRTYGAKGLIRQFSLMKRTYRKNLLAIYRYIRELNEDAIIVQNSLYNSMKKEVQYYGFTDLLLRTWNQAIGEKGIIISRTDSMNKKEGIWLDDIHPNEEGYKLMHELLMQTLETTGLRFNVQEKSAQAEQ